MRGTRHSVCTLYGDRAGGEGGRGLRKGGKQIMKSCLTGDRVAKSELDPYRGLNYADR